LFVNIYIVDLFIIIFFLLLLLDYQYGIRLIKMPENKILITFNARNENDQKLFCRDLADSIAEVNIYIYIYSIYFLRYHDLLDIRDYNLLD
jgi:hypothetical protein